MGVPKFYWWISQRYPCLSEIVKEYDIPEFDNLYLDMNGIIHTCSHPNDDDPLFRITEEKIIADIFHYIEVLFRMIKPKKLFFMAVDGVAPRAKMNQQRGRRFRSAREAQEQEKKAIEEGKEIPKEARFDSNCITPGTEFMARLHEQLKYFSVSKMSNDPLWHGVKVILSGHNTPGEGEHKIMDYIRYMKSKPDHDPNTRHCLYGLDADLIMLGLITHEPRFSLLREEVKFNKKQATKRSSAPEETTWHLLHLSLFREYLGYEFQDLKKAPSFPFDLEKIIDDWVLMGFLVGNDFIPHLPNLHIRKDALPLLYKTYIEVMSKEDGYLNEGGTLNLRRFEKYLEKLCDFEMEKFNEDYEDLQWLESKTSAKQKNEETFGTKSSSVFADDLAALVEESFSEYGITEDDNTERLFEDEFRRFKDSYYKNKMKYERVTPEVLREQSEGYIRALQWNLHYYYNGCCSWSWYFQHHYSPFITDIKGFQNMNLTFDLSKPFNPFEQLLAVLPSLSRKLLPEPYQTLMIDESSPIIDYYPNDFETDLNGKTQEWEAVVLIPFIKEERLLAAMEPLNLKLSDDEIFRNSHGPMTMYNYVPESLGMYDAPEYFPSVRSHAKATEMVRESVLVPRDRLVKGLCKGVRLDVYFKGFPTLRHIPHTSSIKEARVRVFDRPSESPSIVLTFTGRDSLTLDQVADSILGKSIYVEWPHLIEARVDAVASRSQKVTFDFKNKDRKKSKSDERLWETQRKDITSRYYSRFGVEIGNTDILVYASPLIGRRYTFTESGAIKLDKQWARHCNPYVLQATVKEIAVYEASYTQFNSLQQAFPIGSSCFMLGTSNYGALGKVTAVNEAKHLITAEYRLVEEPNLEMIKKNKRNLSVIYYPGYAAAQRVGITPHLLSRITGCLFVYGKRKDEKRPPPRVNIALNLKNNKTSEQVPGWTRKVGEEWQYSQKVVDAVIEYMNRFTFIFVKLSQMDGNDTFTDETLFPPENPQKMKEEVLAFLKSLECSSTERQNINMELLDEPVILAIERAVNDHKQNSSSIRVEEISVGPRCLYRPGLIDGSCQPDPSATYSLFDRIINVREGYSVPLGARGTIIGIHRTEKEQDEIFEVVFDEEFPGALSARGVRNKFYRMYANSVLNISHSSVGDHGLRKPVAVIHPQFSGSEKKGSQKEQFQEKRHPPSSVFPPGASRTILPKQPLIPSAFRGPGCFPAPRGVSGLGPGPFGVFPPPFNQRPAMPRFVNTSQPFVNPEEVPPDMLQMLLQSAKHGYENKDKNQDTKHNPEGRRKQRKEYDDFGPAIRQLSALSLQDNSRKQQKNTSEVGRPVSLEGLFESAKNDAQYHNPCATLMDYLQSSFEGGIPKYQYTTYENSYVHAVVKLPDGKSFRGKDFPTKEKAAESAASKALRALGVSVTEANEQRTVEEEKLAQPKRVQDNKGLGLFPHPVPENKGRWSQDNSGRSSHRGPPMPNFDPTRPPPSYKFPAPPTCHPAFHQSDRYPPESAEQFVPSDKGAFHPPVPSKSQLDPTSNVFIPLQVARRRQQGPKRSGRGMSEPPLQDHGEPGTIAAVQPSRVPQNNAATPDPAVKKKPRARKPRLAIGINFEAPQS